MTVLVWVAVVWLLGKVGGACVQMAFNLGNAIGAYIGGLALSGGYRYPALAGVPFALMGFILFLVFYKKFQDKY